MTTHTSWTLTETDEGEAALQLRKFFTLHPDDLAIVNRARGDAQRLYRALMLVWMRVERVILGDPTELPDPVIAFVAEQLHLSPTVLAGFKTWPTARAVASADIQAHLEVRPFMTEDGERLYAYLLPKVALTGNTGALENAAEDWIAQEGLLRPAGETTLSRIVYRARTQAEEALFATIAAQFPAEACAHLDTLCQTAGGESLLSRLIAAPRAASVPAIKAECQRLRQIRGFCRMPVAWGPVSVNRLRQWAAVVRRQTAQALRRYPPAKRYTLLRAFLEVRAEELTNVIVEMFDVLIGRIFTRSDAELAEVKLQRQQAHQDSAKLFRTIGQILLDPEIPDEQVREAVFRATSRERVSRLVELGEELERGEVETLFALLDRRYGHLREFAPLVLETLPLGSPRAANPVLEGLVVLTDLNQQHSPKVPPTAPLDFIPAKWRRAVQPGGTIQRHAWELCLLHATRAALRAGDMTVAGSRRYAAWDSDLYAASAWQKRRASWYAESGLPEDASRYLAERKADLHEVTTQVARRLPGNTAARVEEEKLILTALEGVDLPPEAERAKRDLQALLPWIDLPELLMEVDHWTHWSDAFFHLTVRREPTADHVARVRPLLFAVLVAEATNLGLATMAQASGLPLHQLTRVADWYLREETLREAITNLIQYHYQQPLALQFGDGTTSSSDGIRFGVAASALHARHQPRYFGRRRGVTLIGHVSDQGSQYWVDVVNCLVRESTYTLDGLLYQDTLPIKEHYTDTGGFTELIFGLFSLLGFRFAPHLRDLPDQVLSRMDKAAHYGPLQPVLTHSIREDLIRTHWDDLNRLAASLKDGLATPSLIVSKLQAMQRQNPIQQAIQEIGRIEKTAHILRYIDDEALRRRVRVGLNKGESLHALARRIFFGQQGRFTQREYEAQLNRATALSLVINAIVVWNTRYLAAAGAELARRQRAVPEDAWPHLSPILWEHVQLVGHYQFTEPEILGELRPLRKEQGGA